MSFEEKYPIRATIMGLTDEQLLDELCRPITEKWELNIYNEALKRILEKLIKMEKGMKMESEKIWMEIKDNIERMLWAGYYDVQEGFRLMGINSKLYRKLYEALKKEKEANEK